MKDSARKISRETIARLSTEELYRILRNSVEAPEYSVDTDTLLEILEVVEQREKEAGNLTDVDAAWERFQTIYAVPEMEGCELYSSEIDSSSNQETDSKPEAKPSGRFRHGWKRALLIAAIIAVLFGVAVQAAGGDFFGALARWTDDVFGFTLDASAAEVGVPVAEDIGETDFPVPWEILPALRPERFVFKELSQRYANTANCINLTYEDSDDRLYLTVLSFTSLSDMETALFEKDKANVQTWSNNGITFYIYTNLEYQTVAWVKGNYVGSIHGHITDTELTNMLNSIGG